MKTKKLLSILLCMLMLASTTIIITSCDKEDEPTTYSDEDYYTDDDGNGDDNGGNSGDNNGSNSGSNSGSNNGNTDVAPNTPTGVKASVQGPKKYPYVLVEWDYVSSGVDHYDIYRSTSKTGSFSKKATRQGYCYNWSDEDLQYNKTYFYKIKAVSSGGKASGFSDVVGVWVEPYNE